MRWVRILVSSSLLMACAGAAVPDTDCADPERPEDRVRFASIVLLGTVTSWDGTTAGFDVEEIWRGPDMPEHVDIVPETGRAYAAGVRYLVFPAGYPSPLSDRRCSATTRWSDALAELRPAAARTPAPAPPADPDLPWEWVIAAAALAGGTAFVRKLRERRRYEPAVWNPGHRIADED